MRCAVVGAGAWGTALADLLARNGHDVRLWAYERDVVDAINQRHENTRFLAGHPLTPGVRATNDLPESVRAAELVTLATPSQMLRGILGAAKTSLGHAVPVVVASKGLERETLALMTAVASQEIPGATVVALSGPSFAAEVVECQPTAVVVASTDADAATIAQRAFSSP
jgi:glycerol-3-phosphate dehydrogenase (NAD(P)+)